MNIPTAMCVWLLFTRNRSLVWEYNILNDLSFFRKRLSYRKRIKIPFSILSKSQTRLVTVVGWLYWGLTSLFQPYRKICVFVFHITREKEGDLTQSYDKTPYTNRKFDNQRTTHTNATKNFDYTTIADRLRTVSWSNK